MRLGAGRQARILRTLPQSGPASGKARCHSAFLIDPRAKAPLIRLSIVPLQRRIPRIRLLSVAAGITYWIRPELMPEL